MTIPIRNNYEDRTFATVRRLQAERRAALPKDIAGLYTDRNLTNGSKRIAGTCVSERNKIERIPSPWMHKNLMSPRRSRRTTCQLTCH